MQVDIIDATFPVLGQTADDNEDKYGSKVAETVCHKQLARQPSWSLT